MIRLVTKTCFWQHIHLKGQAGRQETPEEDRARGEGAWGWLRRNQLDEEVLQSDTEESGGQQVWEGREDCPMRF